MAGLIGKKVRQFRNILTSLRKKDKVFQQRRGDHKTAKLYTKVRVEGNVVVKSYKRDWQKKEPGSESRFAISGHRESWKDDRLDLMRTARLNHWRRRIP